MAIFHPASLFAQDVTEEAPEEPAEEASPGRDDLLNPDDFEFGEAREAPDVDEITVVGTVSDVTNVQDEARAVTAFSMEDLDKQNIVNVEKLAFNVPGLHVGRQGSQVIVTLRGIGTENASPTGEAGVSFNVDGVNYTRPASAQVAFFDLEGVEVLRGPQGTKGGKNATSGWISVISRKPHDEFESSVDFQIGSYDQRRLRTAINIPVSETLSLRTAAIFEDRLGYLDNTFLDDEDRDPFDVDDFGFRQHLRWNVTDSLETLLTYNYYRQGGNGAQIKLIPRPVEPSQCRPSLFSPPNLREPNRLPRRVDCFALPRFDENGNQIPTTQIEFISGDQSRLTDTGTIQTDTPASQSNRFWGFTSTTDWDVPPFGPLADTQLKLIGGFQVTELRSFQDFDGADIPVTQLGLDEETYQQSAEIQWRGDFGGVVDWQFGASFARSSGENQAVLPSLSGFTPTDDPVFNDYPIRGDQKVINSSYATSLHLDWYAREDLTLSAGARYTKDVREIDVLRRVFIPGLIGIDLFDCVQGYTDIGRDNTPDVPAAGGGFTEVAPLSCSQKFREVTGGVNLEYRRWDEQLFYARVDRGAKGGGFSNFGFGSYDPEYIWSFAIGSKNSFFDGRLTLSSEAFYYDYKDLQLVTFDGFAIRTDNADAEDYGLDIEANAELFPGFRLDGKVGYLHAEFTDYSEIDPIDADRSLARDKCVFRPSPINPCPAFSDFSGNKLTRAPEWTASIGAEYDVYLASYGMLTPRVSYYWQDDTWYRPFNAPLDLQEDYHFTNVRLTWQSPNEVWTVAAFVNNLENDRVFQNVLVGPRALNSPQNAWYGEPRLWGLRVGFRY